MEKKMEKEFKHTPVLLNECLEGLNIKPCGIYVDGTLGGGGHSGEILKRLTSGKLIAFDKDEDALSTTKIKLQKFENKITYVKDDFLNIVFKAIGEATEEAVLNAMLNAHEAKTIQGKTCHSLRDYFDLILEEFKE